MFPGLKRRDTRLQRPCGALDVWASGIIARRRDSRDQSRTPRAMATPGTRELGNRPRTRLDQPVVKSRSGSSWEDALGTALTAAGREAALQALENDVYAKTSLAPQVALLRTWRKFHEAWFGKGHLPFPITVASLKAVSSMFKAGKYSSFKNYLYAARGQRIKLGYIWTQLLAKISKEHQISLEGSRALKALSAFGCEQGGTGSWNWSMERGG